MGKYTTFQQNRAAHQGLSNMTGVISKLIKEKIKNLLGTINDLIFPRAELS